MILLINWCEDVYAEDNDTTAVNLQEYIVESKNAWIEKDRAVFVPTRKEKNRANSVETLLSSMNMPYIKVDGELMKDLRGESVSVFINGQEATGVELSTFWPKDVIRVEYLSNPSDPKFKNKRAVVNFIMPVYSVGGVTKFNTEQSVTPYSSYYMASSKLAYKSMTYGASIYYRPTNYSYTDDEYEQYRDIWYNHKKYDALTNKNKGETKSKGNSVNAAFNAIYFKENKMRLVHAASLSWNKDSDEHTQINNWSPQLFTSNSGWNSLKYRNLSAGISGNYGFAFSPKCELSANWEYSYGSIDRETFNRTSDLPVIYNGSNEKAHAAGLSATLSYTFNQHTGLWLIINEKVTNYNIGYTGSYTDKSGQTRGTSLTGLSWWWQPCNTFSLNIMPGVTVNYRHIRGISTESEASPYFYVASNWYQSDKAYMNFSTYYTVANGSASQANEVLQRESELKWFKGNPELGNSTEFRINLQQSWMPLRWLTPTLNIDYLYWKIPYYYYTSAPEDMGGIIQQQFNDRPINDMTVSLNLNSNLFNRKLGLSLSPSVEMMRFGKGTESQSLTRFRIDGNVSYNMGDFSVDVSYRGVEKRLGFGGYMIQYRPDKWGLGITYGNGDFYASFRVDNIFHKHRVQSHDYTFDNYIHNTTYFYPGRQFSLNLSYTFGYGKRINKNINVQAPSQITSGAAGS
ncbi:MAG: hypothetical protein K2M03_02055 [Muribaculaceae bacterium]|nr:hypothetical protein [Muribaculaceae bacterium]